MTRGGALSSASRDGPGTEGGEAASQAVEDMDRQLSA